MNLEQLTNGELLSKFDEIDLPKYALPDRDDSVGNAYVSLLLLGGLDGVQDDADNSRQTIIDFLRNEQFQKPYKTQRVGGRKRKTINTRY